MTASDRRRDYIMSKKTADAIVKRELAKAPPKPAKNDAKVEPKKS